MIERFFALLITCSIFIFIACKKSSSNSNTAIQALNNDLIKIVDSITEDTTKYFYNDSNQVIELQVTYAGSSSSNDYIDTFMYASKELIASQYCLGQVLTSTPYAKSQYVFENGILNSSNYYYSNTQISNCTYFFDSLGRLDSINQFVIDPGLGISTLANRFEYDNNSNLLNIYFSDGTSEYICASFSGYDTHPNPVYEFPWLFDVDVYTFDYDKLSKNNCGQYTTYYKDINGSIYVQEQWTYTYTYDAQGRVATRLTYYPISGTYSSGNTYYYNN